MRKKFVFLISEDPELYGMSQSLGVAFRNFINSIDDNLINEPGVFTMMDESWDGPFYAIDDRGERYHIVKISAVDEYPNGTKLTNDIALHSDTASVSFKSMVSKFGGGENMDLFNQSNTGNMGGQMPEIKNAEQGSKVEIQGMRNAGRQIHKAFGYDLMSKAIATRIGNSWFRYDEEAKSIVDVSGMVMELDFPAMVMPERIENVNAGDVILYNDKLAFVVGREGNQLTIIGNDGEMKSFSGVRNTMMGDNVFIEKVNNMMNEFGFDAEDGLDPAVLMMAAGGMGQQGGGVNPFAIVAMASAFKK